MADIHQNAQEVVQDAKSKGAPFTEPHLDKANIYTWLAWQNPPGRQLHQAVTERILNPHHPHAQKFVSWFKTLYSLTWVLAAINQSTIVSKLAENAHVPEFGSCKK
ncbi:MAG: DUF3226 domain-containing protein [Scytonema sp. PMC 1069.18]|nr:DUF3226 domain-containing protein [Scytonema sp. PMC 1069.18]MEC4881559.1 DUF3226 domain-containing protein [Scytonema sp. PMC 1070.18]